jgi:hypothetical protein
MKEIENLKDAKDRVTQLFKGDGRFRLQSETDIDHYARYEELRLTIVVVFDEPYDNLLKSGKFTLSPTGDGFEIP